MVQLVDPVPGGKSIADKELLKEAQARLPRGKYFFVRFPLSVGIFIPADFDRPLAWLSLKVTAAAPLLAPTKALKSRGGGVRYTARGVAAPDRKASDGGGDHRAVPGGNGPGGRDGPSAVGRRRTLSGRVSRKRPAKATQKIPPGWTPTEK